MECRGWTEESHSSTCLSLIGRQVWSFRCWSRQGNCHSEITDNRKKEPTVILWEMQKIQVWNCMWHCLSEMGASHQTPSNMLWILPQFSVSNEIVDSFHTLYWSFSLKWVIKSAPLLLNKTQDCCNHKTHCWCCWTRSSRRRVWMSEAESSLTGVSCREQF